MPGGRPAREEAGAEEVQPSGPGGRLLKEDVLAPLRAAAEGARQPPAPSPRRASRRDQREGESCR